MFFGIPKSWFLVQFWRPFGIQRELRRDPLGAPGRLRGVDLRMSWGVDFGTILETFWGPFWDQAGTRLLARYECRLASSRGGCKGGCEGGCKGGGGCNLARPGPGPLYN